MVKNKFPGYNNNLKKISFSLKKRDRLRKIFTYSKYLVLLLLGGLLVFSSCRKMDSYQTVPTYLKIDSIYVDTYYPAEGSSSAKITDVWVYVDDQQMGVFELPAKFPLLFAGKHKLEIRPGIKLNGISSTRVSYPFYQPIVFHDFDFYPDSIINLGTLKAEYYQDLKFAWVEDFESSIISIIESDNSDTTIERTMPANNPEAFLSDHSMYSGKIVLTQERPVFMAYTFDEFDLPKDDSPIVLEMNFKTDHILLVGVLVDNPSDYGWEELVYLKETDQWNKIYINIGPVTSRNPNAFGFKVYFTAALNSSETEAKIYLDNIKLIHRTN